MFCKLTSPAHALAIMAGCAEAAMCTGVDAGGPDIVPLDALLDVLLEAIDEPSG